MRLEKEVRIDAPIDAVWALVADIQTLGTCVPGLEQLQIIDDRHFDSVVRFRMGPLSMRFRLRSEIEALEPPHRVVMVTEGDDRSVAGNVRQRQEFVLTPAAGATDVRITSDVQISGRFATFGQRIIAAQADDFANQVVANVARLLAQRDEAQ
jgi:carbon monoxide dehydrogenase subunit G